MTSAAPRILDWYRADPWPGIRRVLLVGPPILTLGGLVIAVSLASRLPRALVDGATVVGLVLVAGGVLFTMVGMNRLLRDDVSLAVRTDGVAVRAAGVETLVRWEALGGARWDARRRELVLESPGASPIAVARPFRGIAGGELADRIVRARQKAAMGLLR